jgi:hypothetical protein
MAQPTSQRLGPAAMPPPRSNRTPHFSGQVGNPLKDFFYEYKEFADSCGLTEHQKVETVIRYIPISLQDFWKSQNGYSTGDWADLKHDLLDIYDDTPAQSHHSKQKLVDFIRWSAKLHMHDEEDVQEYYQQFLVLSKPLLDAHHLTIGECNKAFWCGFHSKDRHKMYIRLIANNPFHLAREHFNYLDVYKVARATFSGNHLLDLDKDDQWEEPQGAKDRWSGCTPKRWLDQEERGPWRLDSDLRTHEHQPHLSFSDHLPHESQRPNPCFSPSPESHYQQSNTHCSPSSDARYRHSNNCCTPLPEVETKIVCFKEPEQDKEHEMDDLLRCMRALSAHKEAYAMLYEQCAIWFPSLVQVLPKPLFTQPTLATAFSMQTPPALLAQQPW